MTPALLPSLCFSEEWTGFELHPWAPLPHPTHVAVQGRGEELRTRGLWHRAAGSAMPHTDHEYVMMALSAPIAANARPHYSRPPSPAALSFVEYAAACLDRVVEDWHDVLPTSYQLTTPLGTGLQYATPPGTGWGATVWAALALNEQSRSDPDTYVIYMPPGDAHQWCTLCAIFGHECAERGHALPRPALSRQVIFATTDGAALIHVWPSSRERAPSLPSFGVLSALRACSFNPAASQHVVGWSMSLRFEYPPPRDWDDESLIYPTGALYTALLALIEAGMRVGLLVNRSASLWTGPQGRAAGTPPPHPMTVRIRRRQGRYPIGMLAAIMLHALSPGNLVRLEALCASVAASDFAQSDASPLVYSPPPGATRFPPMEPLAAGGVPSPGAWWDWGVPTEREREALLIVDPFGEILLTHHAILAAPGAATIAEVALLLDAPPGSFLLSFHDSPLRPQESLTQQGIRAGDSLRLVRGAASLRAAY